MKPGMPPKMMSAKPYIGRALRLLGEHKALTAVTMLLSMMVTLLPFVVSVAFASIFQILGQFAAPLPPGARNPNAARNIWEMTAPLFGKSDTSG
jgi:hypothetical protein